MKISEMITDRYKLRIPPTVYYDLLYDVQEMEEEQEPTTKNDKVDREYTDCKNCVNHKYCDYEPTTKNDLGVEEVTALAEWTTKLTKECEEAYNKGYADGVKSVNICPHCGEYIGEEE